MEITKVEHEIIKKYVPNYNREKSYIKCETLLGGKVPSFFVVKIYKKGIFEYKDNKFRKIN